MSKILLIDDEANQGWKEILEKVFFEGQDIAIATTKHEAVELLSQDAFELIFLDLRYGENDHHSSDLKTYQGYEILTQEIRGGFEKLNFATPVILFTASNKIWNIHGMLDAGADSFYIKEHPDQATDLDFSRQNFIRLTQQIPSLLEMGKVRSSVLKKVNVILDLIEGEVKNLNIRERIAEKLKIGYTTLFHRHSSFEHEKFAFNNELMTYICFWSILEEIAKDSFEDKWIKSGPHEGKMAQDNWNLRNGQRFIENLTFVNSDALTGYVRVQLVRDGVAYKKQQRDIPIKDKDIIYFQGKIGLPLQIYALMILGKGWTAAEAKNRFYDHIQFRNRVDFIHSSVEAIFTKNMSNQQDKSQAQAYCIKMLDFLYILLSSPWTNP